MSWHNIEPHAGVFTELLELLQVKGVEVEELHSFDERKVNNFWPIHGVVLFYSCELMEKHDIEYPITNLFFAHQAHDNSCATQALLSVVMNCPKVDIGPKLSALKESAMDLSPDLRGQAIVDDEALRSVHNEFAPEEMYGVKVNGVYHFVSYLPVNGILYELDGLEKGPISLGEFGEKGEIGWLELLRPVIRERVDHYTQRKIKFSLMAVIKSRVVVIEAYLQELDKEEERIKQREEELTDRISGVRILREEAENSGKSPTAIIKEEMHLTHERDALYPAFTKVRDRMNKNIEKVIRETEKYKKIKEENRLRKHNFIPLIFNLLKLLAEKGQLKPLIEKAEQQKSKKR